MFANKPRINQQQTEQSDSAVFEQALVSQVAENAIIEQRRARRWGIFFKLITFAYIAIFGLLLIPLDSWQGTPLSSEKHTALIDISGIIATNAPANADHIVSGLRQAYEDKNTHGIILRINSPGGSPVQAAQVNNEIYRLREKHPDIPFYSVITDICASGGYYIAVAADKIYADKASVVGSIGVVMSGFGFVGTLEKLGIERRLLHAGKNKALLDPFLPLKNSEVAHIETLLEDIHQEFVAIVKKGRGERLTDDEKVFSGLIWTGHQSIALGLVDELGSAGYVAREVIGAEKIVDFTKRETLLDQFVNSMSNALARTLGTRLSEFSLR